MAVEAIKEAGLPAVTTLIVHRQPDDPRRPDPARTPARCSSRRAPTSSASTAAAARARCSRSCRTSSSAFPAPSPPFPFPTGRPPTSRRSRRSVTRSRRHAVSRPRSTRSRARRYDLADFAREADALGVRYLGICCGNAPHLTRSLAESAREDAAGKPLLAGHVEARLLRRRPEPEGREPRVRQRPLTPLSARDRRLRRNLRAPCPRGGRQPDVAIVACCDVRRDVAEGWRGPHGCERAYGDYPTMIREHDLDAVLLADLADPPPGAGARAASRRASAASSARSRSPLTGAEAHELWRPHARPTRSSSRDSCTATTRPSARSMSSSPPVRSARSTASGPRSTCSIPRRARRTTRDATGASAWSAAAACHTTSPATASTPATASRDAAPDRCRPSAGRARATGRSTGSSA